MGHISGGRRWVTQWELALGSKAPSLPPSGARPCYQSLRHIPRTGLGQEFRGESLCLGLAVEGATAHLPYPRPAEPADVDRRANPGATCDFTEQICGGKLLCARAGPVSQPKLWLSGSANGCPSAGTSLSWRGFSAAPGGFHSLQRTPCPICAGERTWLLPPLTGCAAALGFGSASNSPCASTALSRQPWSFSPRQSLDGQAQRG